MVLKRDRRQYFQEPPEVEVCLGVTSQGGGDRRTYGSNVHGAYGESVQMRPNAFVIGGRLPHVKSLHRWTTFNQFLSVHSCSRVAAH